MQDKRTMVGTLDDSLVTPMEKVPVTVADEYKRDYLVCKFVEFPKSAFSCSINFPEKFNHTTYIFLYLKSKMSVLGFLWYVTIMVQGVLVRLEMPPKVDDINFFPATADKYARTTLMATPQKQIFESLAVKFYVLSFNLMCLSKINLHAIISVISHDSKTRMTVYGAPKTTFMFFKSTPEKSQDQHISTHDINLSQSKYVCLISSLFLFKHNLTYLHIISLCQL